MKGDILLQQNEKPTEWDGELQIPSFMNVSLLDDFSLTKRNREVKEDKDTRETVRTLAMAVSMISMCYSFLWIDEATLPSLIGTFVSLLIFVGVARGAEV